MLLVAALAVLATPADWIPARWFSSDPASLELLDRTPINCLLLERAQWTPNFLDAAATKGIITLGVLRPGDPTDFPRQLNGIVLEGDWSTRPTIKAPAIVELPPRSRMSFGPKDCLIGTYQAVWPGIQSGDHAKAAPSGGPWIDTNEGFLRFARAATPATIWIANTPPPKNAFTTERYLQVISDAAILGARWVVALDEDLAYRLEKREPEAVKTWQRIAAQLAWFEEHKNWRQYRPVGELAIVQDVDTGALYSGGVLDMIAVKHTPVIPVPTHLLPDASMAGSKMAVNVVPGALSPAQKEALAQFTRSGGRLLNGPPDWHFPPMSTDKITLAAGDVKKLDEIWRELNEMTGRRNLGARLFNVSSMLSSLLRSPDGSETILHLVNYSDFPVENVTVHVLGKYKSATFIAPGAAPRKLETYEVEEGEGTGVDIEKVGVNGTVLLEPLH